MFGILSILVCPVAFMSPNFICVVKDESIKFYAILISDSLRSSSNYTEVSPDAPYA